MGSCLSLCKHVSYTHTNSWMFMIKKIDELCCFSNNIDKRESLSSDSVDQDCYFSLRLVARLSWFLPIFEKLIWWNFFAVWKMECSFPLTFSPCLGYGMFFAEIANMWDVQFFSNLGCLRTKSLTILFRPLLYISSNFDRPVPLLKEGFFPPFDF